MLPDGVTYISSDFYNFNYHYDQEYTILHCNLVKVYFNEKYEFAKWIYEISKDKIDMDVFDNIIKVQYPKFYEQDKHLAFVEWLKFQ